MADLPVPRNKSSVPDKLDPLREVIVQCLAAKMRPAEIAKHLAPEDKKKRAYWRKKIWKMVREDAMLHTKGAQQAQAEMFLGLIPATQALTRRASKGRPDAIKLLFEASGFHNPKVKHEHSGDIKVELSMPRPDRVETEDSNVVDAEVVEEE